MNTRGIRPSSPRPLFPYRSAAVWLATGFSVGLWAPAPGTAGAALGSLLAWGIAHLPGFAWQIAAIVALNLAGIPLCTVAGRRLGGKKDNKAIIWDEITSVPLVFLIVPLAGWAVAIAGFLLHRLFDITKPPPAWQMERLPDGLGVMADDWIAGIYACLALAILAWLDQRLSIHLLSAAAG